jgi:hypothetical protein
MLLGYSPDTSYMMTAELAMKEDGTLDSTVDFANLVSVSTTNFSLQHATDRRHLMLSGVKDYGLAKTPSPMKDLSAPTKDL